MKTSAFFCNRPGAGGIGYVYDKGRRERVGEISDLFPDVVTAETFDALAPQLGGVEAIFSTWGMPALTAEQVERLSSLEVVFYAAGSVKGFARPFLEQGVQVVTARAANGIAVAQFTVGQILLSGKGYFRNTMDCRSPEKRRKGGVQRGLGLFGETVALIGAGAIGREVTRLLANFDLEIIVVDPFLTPEAAAEMGVRVVGLEEAFRTAYVVSNHLPNLPELKAVLNRELFGSMRDGATFINTGRGAQVDETGMIAVLKERPDLTALLDVTLPEPPEPDSELYTLPNVQLSSHIAGAMNNEVVRMADLAIEEFLRWEAGEPLQHAVTLDMLEHMA